MGFAVYYWLIATEPGELTDSGLLWRLIVGPIALLAGVISPRAVTQYRLTAREAAAALGERRSTEAQIAAAKRTAEIRDRYAAIYGYALTTGLRCSSISRWDR